MYARTYVLKTVDNMSEIQMNNFNVGLPKATKIRDGGDIYEQYSECNRLKQIDFAQFE